MSINTGYFVGGSSNGEVVTADKLVFSTDTTAAQSPANLSQARSGLAGCNSSANGYFAGGVNNITNKTITDKLVFNTDTTAAQSSANISQARNGLTGCNSLINGYFAGGNSGTSVATADKLVFSTDTTTAKSTANLSQARTRPIGCNSISNGYFIGGVTTGAVSVATADKLVFSTDTTAAQSSANLSRGRDRAAGCHSLTSGYSAGGITNTNTDFVTTADKLVFSTDTTAAQASANISQARSLLAGCHSWTNGYFAGGVTGNTTADVVATTDKLVFSTDTTATQSPANLSQARNALAGCSANLPPSAVLALLSVHSNI